MTRAHGFGYKVDSGGSRAHLDLGAPLLGQDRRGLLRILTRAASPHVQELGILLLRLLLEVEELPVHALVVVDVSGFRCVLDDALVAFLLGGQRLEFLVDCQGAGKLVRIVKRIERII